MQTIGQSLDSTKSTHDLSFLTGEWIMKMTYNPESKEPKTLEGAMCCEWVMDSTYIKCEYALERQDKKNALNDVYFNYSAISEKYESMWMSSTWPVKVLLAGDIRNEKDTIRLETCAEFSIGNGIIEHVRDVLTIKIGAVNFNRKTYIKTSEETEWKYHSLEEASQKQINPILDNE